MGTGLKNDAVCQEIGVCAAVNCMDEKTSSFNTRTPPRTRDTMSPVVDEIATA